MKIFLLILIFNYNTYKRASNESAFESKENVIWVSS